ncbi:MAG: hypothetical protein Q9165_001875 [Trypethelium subeluteriae]
MAEVFGVVASSVEIIKTVLKLRSLWNEVKEAPATVSDLLEEAELIGNILCATEETFSSAKFPPDLYHATHVTGSTALCRRAQKSLHDAAEVLNNKLASTHRFRKRLVAVKIRLEKEDIERLTTKLDRAVRLLILANQHVHSTQNSYMLSQLSSAVKQPHMIRAEASTDTEVILKPVVGDTLGQGSDSSAVSSLKRKHATSSNVFSTWILRRPQSGLRYHSSPTEFSCQVSLPTWYAQMIWEVQLIKAISGWNFFFRKYTYQQEDSQVFRCVKAGDIKALQELFDRGEASLFDRDFEYGDTLQHVSVSPKTIFSLGSPFVGGFIARKVESFQVLDRTGAECHGS